MRKEVRRWDIDIKNLKNSTLVKLEREIHLLSSQLNDGYFSEDCKSLFAQLEVDRLKILLFWEESWRLKSQAPWLKSGDNNTRFFLNFANQRRLNKLIRDLSIDGRSICDQNSLKKAA